MTITIIHIGAGNHSIYKTEKYKKLIKSTLVKPNNDSIFEKSEKLEKSNLTNTGYGSSLNIQGNVECDSSYLEISTFNHDRNGLSIFNIKDKYPITETNRILQKINRLYDKGTKFHNMGLTKPLILNHDSTHEIDRLLFDQRLNMPIDSSKTEDLYDPKLLILSKSQRIYDSYMNSLNFDSTLVSRNECVQDTIGLIEISELKTAIATSSGGNFFKLPGRIGCAGVIGCAIDNFENDDISISCMCSGNGEDIIRMSLAKRVTKFFEHYDGDEYVEDLVSLFKKENAYIGIIVIIRFSKSGQGRLIYCHSTESFYFGFKVNGKIEIVLSRLDKPVGKFIRGEYKI